MASDPLPPSSPPDALPTVPTSPVVCVPVNVDAFVLNESLFADDRKSKIAPLNLPDYSGLGHGSALKADVVPPVDIHAASPIGKNPRVTDVAGDGQTIPGRLGVYLHWTLPKAFRTGVAASQSVSEGQHNQNRADHGFPASKSPGSDASSESPEFRPIPDRWLIYRFVQPSKGAELPPGAELVTASVLESNRLRKLAEFAPGEDVEIEASPFLDPEAEAHDQDDIWIGCKYDLEQWTGTQDAPNKYHSPLTVTNASNSLFPDYQLHNSNVLSFHDDMSYVDSNGVNQKFQNATCSYFVFGFYKSADQDPFFRDPPLRDPPVPASQGTISEGPTNETILNSCFFDLNDTNEQWKSWTKAPVNRTRLVCHGTVYGVEWQLEKPPGVVPAEDLAKRIAQDHPVAVGLDAVDALEAYIDTEGEDKTEPSLLHRIAELLKSEHEDIHAQRSAEKELVKRQFRPEAGGVHWHSSHDPEDSQAPTSPDELAQPSSAPGSIKPSSDPLAGSKSITNRPDAVEHTLVHELNVLQSHYDACERHRDHLQFLLYCEWWKARAEQSDDSEKEDGASKAERIKLIKSRVQTLARSIRLLGLHDSGKGITGELNERIHRVKAHPKVKNSLKSGIDPDFYIRKDPTAVLLNVQSTWPDEFLSSKLPVRLSHALPLRNLNFTDQKTAGRWNVYSPGANMPSSFRDFLDKAQSIPSGSTADTPTSDDMLRLWLSAWPSMTELARRPVIPDELKELKDVLVDLLTEWVFLANDSYGRLDQTLTRNFLKPRTGKLAIAEGGTKQIGQTVKASEQKPSASVPFVDLTLNKKTPGDIDWNDTQAWFPLFLEWEVEYFHVPFSCWKLEPSEDGSFAYEIWQSENLSAQHGIRDDTRILRGRCLILPQVTQILRAHVERVIKQTPPKHALPEKASTKDDILAAVEQLPFLSATLDGFTSHLVTCVGGAHVAPRLEQTSQTGITRDRTRPASSEIFDDATLLLMAGADTHVTPYGRYLDFQHHHRDGKDARYSPFKAASHGQARFRKLNIVDKFGQVVPSLTSHEGRDQGVLLPYLSPTVSCRSSGPDEPYLANTVVQEPEGQCEFFQVPPAINQAARLNACFVVEDEEETARGASNGGTRKSWRPTNDWENPIWGWIVVNFRDCALQIFQQDGTFFAEALLREKQVFWRPSGAAKFAGDDDRESIDTNEPKIATTDMDFLLQHLKSEQYLQKFMDTIIEALECLHHAPNHFADAVAATFGRPLALVNMGWSLELAVSPLEDHSTDSGSAALKDSSTQSTAAKPITDYSFDLKLGDKHSYDDGLIGYFRPSASGQAVASVTSPGQKSLMASFFEYAELCTDFNLPNLHKTESTFGELSRVSHRPFLKPFFVDPTNMESHDYRRRRNQELQVFSALVDPFSIITGYSGILPPKQLQLSPWAVESALRNMTPFLSAGPVLIPGDMPSSELLGVATFGSGKLVPPNVKVDQKSRPRIPANVPDAGEWIWLQPHALDPDAEDLEYREVDLSPPETQFRPLEGPHTAIEGFMQQRSPPPEVNVGANDRVEIEKFGDIFGNPWTLTFSGRGSCGGLPNEDVELTVTLTKNTDEHLVKMAAECPLRAKFKIQIIAKTDQATSMDLLRETLFDMSSPRVVRYRRPATDYRVVVVVSHIDTAIRLVFSRLLPVEKSRDKLLSASLSTLDVPKKQIAGMSCKGTLILRDRANNAVSGYDDRQWLDFEGWPSPPKVSLDGSVYSLAWAGLPEGKHELSVLLKDTSIGTPVTVDVIPAVNAAKSIARGTGLCDGAAKEMVQIEVFVADKAGAQALDRDLKIEVIPDSGKTMALTTSQAAGASKGWQSASFCRPQAGRFKVHVKVDDCHICKSPYTVQSTSTPVQWDITKLSVEIASTVKPTLSVSLFDSLGMTLRMALPNLVNARLRCNRRTTKGVSEDQQYRDLDPKQGDGTYVTLLDLTNDTTWQCVVELYLDKGGKAFYQVPGTLRVSKQGTIVVQRTGKGSQFETIRTTGKATILTVPWTEWSM